MTTDNIIKENTILISLEEYENTKAKITKLENKINELNTVINDNSKIIVTRYDLSPNEHVQELFVDHILKTYRNLIGQKGSPSYYVNGEGTIGQSIYEMDLELDIEQRREKCMKDAIKSFVKLYLNTDKKPDYSKVFSKIINFDDVEKEIKEVYNHKYFEEYGERVLKLENDEKELQEKQKKLDKDSRIQSYIGQKEILQGQINDLKKKIENLKNDNNILNLRIDSLHKEISDKDKQLELYRTTIEDQKSLRDYKKDGKKFFNFD